MTLLAADIGNSDTVLGLLEGAEVVAHWRVSTDERRTSDEWAVLVRPRHSRKAYARQIAVDVAIALVALLIMVLLS
jgi:pantothenate kinase type III